MECIFCKIANGEISSAKVYEDEKHIAFLDINPANEGHTLVIPKKHVAELLELSDEEIRDLSVAVKRVAAAVKKATNAEGYNILGNNGKAAGQVIFHVHIHVIPRFSGDGLSLRHNREKYKNDEEMEEMRRKVEENIS